MSTYQSSPIVSPSGETIGAYGGIDPMARDLAPEPATTGPKSWPAVAWLRAHPFFWDCLLTVVTLAIVLASLPSLTVDEGSRDLNAAAWLLSIATVLPIAVRRVWPVPAAVVNLFALVAYSALKFPPSPAAISTLIMLYTLAAHCPRRVSLGWLAVTLASTILILNVDGTSDNFASYASNFALLAAGWAIGDSLQSRRQYVSELEDRAARLEHEREEKARQAVADERARIARELHDVVAHHVSVMVVQAGGARRMIDQEPDRSKEALETIEVTGRDALTEMRRLLGVLRDQDEATDDLLPQPRVNDVGELVQSMRESGLPVDLRIDGEPPEISPGIELSVYRIVQEALTNTLKHAGPARAEVRIRYGDDGVDVEVRDDGRGAAVASVNGSGHGIVGMRERVALFGGELELGPRVGGGFRVSARLPLHEREA